MRRLRPCILLLPVLLGLALFYEVLVGGRVFFWHDVSCMTMPLQKLAAEAVRAGRLPFWSPALACGFPVLAEGEAGVFYPASALLYLGVPYYHAYSWAAALQCLLAALGAVLLGRRLGLGWLAASHVGLAFGFSGYFLSKVIFLAVLQSAAWLPWLLLCLLAGLESGRWSAFVAGALVLALALLGGHPQIVFYELLAAGLLALWYLCAPGRTAWWRRSARSVVGTCVLVAGGLGLAALQLLPTYHLTRFAATRTATDPELLRSLALQPRNLALLVHPYLFGSYAENNYWGRDHYFEVCAYVGGLTLLLAGAALLLRRLPLRHKGYWIALGLLGLAMALADLNPVYEFLPQVPGFNLFRAPARYLLLTSLSLALLAGGMVQALAGHARRAAGRALVIGSVVGLLLAGGLMGSLHLARPQIIAALGRVVADDPGPASSTAAAKAEAKWEFLTERLSIRDLTWLAFLGGLLVAGGLGLVAARGTLPYRVGAAALLVVLAGQLYLFGRQANPTVTPDYYTTPPRTAVAFHESPTWGREYGDPAVEWQSFVSRDYPGYAQGDMAPYWAEREVLRRNRAWLYEVPAAHAYYTLLPRRQADLLDELVPNGLADQPGGAGAPLQVLRMLGVRSLIGAPGLRSPWLRPVLQERTYAQYRLTAPLPSAFLPLRVVTCAGESEVRTALTAPAFRPEETALVEGLAASEAEKLGGAWAVARLLEMEGERAAWEVRSPRPALLVLNMAYNPNWRAAVNGKRAEVYRTNYMQCGVIVPAGLSQVEAEYREEGFWQGLCVTQGTAVALALLLLFIGVAEALPRRRAARQFFSPKGDSP